MRRIAFGLLTALCLALPVSAQEDPVQQTILNQIEAATAFTLNDPKAAWGLFIKGRPQLDDELNRRAFADTLPRLAHVPAAADPARYETFSQFLKDQGLIQTARPSTDYLVYPKA